MRRLLLLSLCLLAAPAWAQATLDVQAVEGDTGEPLVGVVVQLTNAEIGLSAQGSTNAVGAARFPGLSTAGAYTVTVAGTDALNETAIGGIRLRTNEVRSVLLVVGRQLGGALNEVVVQGSTPAAVDFATGEVSATLRPAEVREIPTEGRDLTRTLYRLPGVTQATGFYPEAPNVSINGAGALSAQYLIDGLDNNENFLGGQKFPIPTGAVQDVTVLTSTYSAEFGRTGNGVVNVTTRGGSNDVTGEAFYLTRPGSVLDAESSTPGRDLSGNLVQDGFQRHQAGLAAGFPITRDRTFAFVNLEQTVDFKDNQLSAGALGVNETIPGQNRATLGTARVDHRWSPAARSTLRLHVGDAQYERQGGGLDGGVAFPSAGSTQIRRSALAAFQTVATFGSVVSETDVQLSRFRWDYADGTSGTAVQVLGPVDQTGDAPIAFLGNPGFTFNDLERSVQLRQKLTAQRGAHTLRVGADLLRSDFDLLAGGPSEGAYRVRLTADQLSAVQALNRGVDLRPEDLPADVEVLGYSVELKPTAFGVAQTQLGVYAEDQWAASPQLTVTAGLRWDFDTLSKGGSDSYDLDNVAPRLQANYRLDDRTSLRAGYGIFYDKIIYAVYSDALQQNSTAQGFRDQLQQLVDQGILPSDTDLDRVTFDGTLTVDATDLTPGYLQGPSAADVQDRRAGAFAGERRILNPNGYDNPYTHQFSLGAQRQVADGVRVGLDVVHTRAENLFRLRDLNGASTYVITPDDIARAQAEGRDLSTLVRSVEEGDATRPVAFRDTDGNAIPGAARNIVISETEGKARYTGATLTALVARRPLGDLLDGAARLSYTLARLENDTEDINFRAQNASDFEAEFGPSVNDRTHVLSGVLTGYLGGATLTVAGLVQSGQPINRVPDAALFGTTDLNGSGDGLSRIAQYTGSADRQPGESRNSDRLPWSSQVDLGVSYELPVAGQAIELRADIFNVFNATNLSGYSNNASVSNQIQVGPAGSAIVERSAGPPRQFQFGARVLF